MSLFRQRLSQLGARRSEGAPRRWIWAPYDQLTADLGPLATADPRTTGVLLVESPWKAAQRPYHRTKLVQVLAAGRHFALELAERGFAVRVETAHTPYAQHLAGTVARLGPLTVMVPAERELRHELAPLVADGGLVIVPHEGWLTTRAEFLASASRSGQPPWRLDSFYKHVRQRSGLLMTPSGEPVGGRYSFDADNRQRWSGEPPAAAPPRFVVDPITAEVHALVSTRYAHHPGEVDLPAIATTHAEVEALWAWAKAQCLTHFGPYEDAMSRASTTLFHTRISPLLNLQRLSPARVVAEVAALDAPLASREGFVRQVLGWREFVHHVHDETDGLRRLGVVRAPADRQATPAEVGELDAAGDGGYARWAGRPWPRGPAPHAEGGSAPNTLGARTPLPAAYWGAPSGLACLDTVIQSVWREGYSHHITRLMILANWATLLDVSPRELTDWFWVAYADAYDWVVEPNVLGMGTFAAGPLMTTKPYVSGAAYVHRMSDYCRGCAFDPQSTCPMTRLYWSFLRRHADTLADVARAGPVLATARRRSAEEVDRDEHVRARVLAALGAGQRLTPGDLAAS